MQLLISFAVSCAYLRDSSCDLSHSNINTGIGTDMTLLKSIAAIALVQASLLLPAHAGENLAAIKSAGVFKVGTEGTYAPFTFHDASGKLAGFDVEIAEAIAAASKPNSSKASGMG